MTRLENNTTHGMYIQLVLKRDEKGEISRSKSVYVPRKDVEKGDNNRKGTPGVLEVTDPAEEAALEEALKDKNHQKQIDDGDLIVKQKKSPTTAAAKAAAQQGGQT
jgi:hypothetical protein